MVHNLCYVNNYCNNYICSKLVVKSQEVVTMNASEMIRCKKPLDRHVEQALQSDQYNKDKYQCLLVHVWNKYLPQKYKINIPNEILASLPSPEAVSRVCREYQNRQLKYRPSQTVQHERRKAEERFTS